MADDTAKKDYAKLDAEYMEGKRKPLEDYGSVILTSSKFLNSARLRDIYAQEGLRKNGYDVPPTYMVYQANQALAELSDENEIEALIAEEKTLKPDFAAWLKGFGRGTLGAMVHDYFASRPGFELNFTNRGVQPTSDYKYLQKQRTLAHDIEHMITGFGPNPAGEYALIAVNLKAYYNYFSPDLACELTRMTGFLLSTGLMKANLHYPKVMGAVLDAVQQGTRMGDTLKRPLLVTNWRTYLDWPIADIRADLNIIGAPPPGTWDWTAEARRG